MGGFTPSNLHELAHSVCLGCFALDLDCDNAEEEHLDGGAGSVPERARHAILPRDVGGLKKSRSPFKQSKVHVQHIVKNKTEDIVV